MAKDNPDNKFKNLLKKKSGKQPGVTEKVIRLLEIYLLIAQKGNCTVEFLMEKFGVTERTIYRDLKIIGEIDELETISNGNNRKIYRFKNGKQIKKSFLSDDELILMLTIANTIPNFGHSFKTNFHTLLNRLIDINKLSSYKNEVPIMIKMSGVIENEKTNEFMKIISECTLSKYKIEIEYKALYDNQVKKRIVDPYGLVFYQGSWMLVGFCQFRKDIRSFLVDRIVELDRTWKSFTPIKDFNLEKYFSPSWGIHDADPVDITVRFSSKVSQYISRKEKWHSSEKRKILPSGDIELSFTVGGTDEIKRWIYSWIPYVEVTKPDWLRKQVNDELSKTVKKHL